MNTIENTFVPLSEIVTEFCQSTEGKDLFERLKNQKEEDEARWNLRNCHELTEEHMAAEANFSCAAHRFVGLNGMRSEWGSDGFDDYAFDDLYEEYHDYVLRAAEHIKAYRARRKVLQRAVIKQDKLRKRGM
jgi:hypothetical protein